MLSEVNLPSNQSIIYSYNLENRLKTRRNTTDWSLDIYYYDGRDIVMEKDAAGNINSLYVRGPDGEMLKEKRRYTNTSGSFMTKYYYYPDRIGSVYMVCDDHGMILEKENADAFGNSKTVGISKNGLSSNMYDSDTGLYYFHARWYDPKTARFLEMDPVITEAGLMNMYEYCASNPNNTDRYGEFSFNDVLNFINDVYDDVRYAFSKGNKTGNQEPTNTPIPPEAEAQAQQGPVSDTSPTATKNINGYYTRQEKSYVEAIYHTLNAGRKAASAISLAAASVSQPEVSFLAAPRAVYNAYGAGNEMGKAINSIMYPKVVAVECPRPSMSQSYQTATATEGATPNPYPTNTPPWR
jgi:RHS repeat-associated protein